VTLEMDKVGN
jgi:hypothetical protein